MSLLNTMAGLGQLGVDSDDDWNIAPDKSQSELLLLTDSGDCLIAKWLIVHTVLHLMREKYTLTVPHG